jgi:hypothetical protein
MVAESLKRSWAFLKHWTGVLLAEWWADIGDKARPHFVTFLLAIPLYELAWVAARLLLS